MDRNNYQVDLDLIVNKSKIMIYLSLYKNIYNVFDLYWN